MILERNKTDSFWREADSSFLQITFSNWPCKYNLMATKLSSDSYLNVFSVGISWFKT